MKYQNNTHGCCVQEVSAKRGEQKVHEMNKMFLCDYLVRQGYKAKIKFETLTKPEVNVTFSNITECMNHLNILSVYDLLNTVIRVTYYYEKNNGMPRILIEDVKDFTYSEFKRMY